MRSDSGWRERAWGCLSHQINVLPSVLFYTILLSESWSEEWQRGEGGGRGDIKGVTHCLYVLFFPEDKSLETACSWPQAQMSLNTICCTIHPATHLSPLPFAPYSCSILPLLASVNLLCPVIANIQGATSLQDHSGLDGINQQQGHKKEHVSHRRWVDLLSWEEP